MDWLVVQRVEQLTHGQISLTPRLRSNVLIRRISAVPLCWIFRVASFPSISFGV